MAGFIKTGCVKTARPCPMPTCGKRFWPCWHGIRLHSTGCGGMTAIWKMNAVMSLRAIVPPEKICQPTRATKGALFTHPVFMKPAINPALVDCIAHILGIGKNHDFALLFQGGKAFNHGRNFHPVICRLAKAAADFAPIPGICKAQDCSPAPWAGIAQTGSVSMNNNLFHFLCLFDNFKPPASRERLSCLATICRMSRDCRMRSRILSRNGEGCNIKSLPKSFLLALWLQ